MRRLLATLVAAVTLAVPSAAWAQEESGGSPVEQVLSVSDESLGERAASAVVRAYDRGYDLLQIVEALLEGLVAEDGTIVDESNGQPLEPFRAPSALIEENVTGAPAGGSARPGGGDSISGERIAILLLERGIDRTTTKLDKKVDLGSRAEDAGVSDESLFTMLAVLILIHQGYSPEQVIVDGFVAGGIRGVPGYPGVLLVDENGKRIDPDGVEKAPEQEEAADQVDAFIGDIVDTLTGIPPSAGADTPFKPAFQIDVEISFSGDAPVTIVGEGRLGVPRNKSQRGYVVGSGDGEMAGAGECSLSEGGIVGDADPHPYEVSGPVKLGFSGPAADGRATLRMAMVEVDATVTGDDSFCVDLIRDLSGIYESTTFGPVEVRLKDGATGTATSTFADSTVDVTVTISA